jgi:UDP-3-O-[3-hydroxymyristoyl] glucosamine N-acyltransferase
VGLAGGARIGDDALLAGQVGVADHVRVGEGARVGAGSGVARDVGAQDTVSGYPAFAHSRWLRASVLFTRLDGIVRQLQRIEQRIEGLEAKPPPK